MKKISLLKGLALLGAVGLTSICVIETALLINKKSGPEIDTAGSQTGDVINLNTYSGYTLAEEIKYDVEPLESEIKGFLQNNGIQLTTEEPFKFTNINDLDVVVDSSTKTFSVIAKNNSPDYVGQSTALIHYATPTKTNIASIINNTVIYLDDKFEDEELTKSNILTSLKNSNPALNINHLALAWNGAYGQDGSAIVSIKQGSSLYVGNPIGVTYNTSGSVTMTLDKNVIAQGQTVTPTFKYHGGTVTGVTYSCSAPSANFAFSTTTGVLTYTSGNTADFFGGAYNITASYETDGNAYIASQIVFAQSNIQTATVTISAPNINASNKNSGTTTFKVNGTIVTTNLAYAISPSLPSGQGLSFNTTTGVLTWDGSTPTNGGMFTITGTNSGTGIKTSVGENKVFVASALASSLTVTNSYIQTGALNSGTLTFTINGKAYTTNATYTTVGLVTGVTWDGTARQVKWDGTTSTTGCVVTITASYTLDSQVIKAETKVTVAKSDLNVAVPITWAGAGQTNFSAQEVISSKNGNYYNFTVTLNTGSWNSTGTWDVIATLTGITFNNYFYFTGMCETDGVTHGFRTNKGNTIMHASYGHLDMNKTYRIGAVIPINT